MPLSVLRSLLIDRATVAYGSAVPPCFDVHGTRRGPKHRPAIHFAAVDREVVGVCQTGELSCEQVIWKLYLAAEYRGRSRGVQLLRHAISSLPDGTDHCKR